MYVMILCLTHFLRIYIDHQSCMTKNIDVLYVPSRVPLQNYTSPLLHEYSLNAPDHVKGVGMEL